MDATDRNAVRPVRTTPHSQTTAHSAVEPDIGLVNATRASLARAVGHQRQADATDRDLKRNAGKLVERLNGAITECRQRLRHARSPHDARQLEAQYTDLLAERAKAHQVIGVADAALPPRREAPHA
jgi:hypothetical protein